MIRVNLRMNGKSITRMMACWLGHPENYTNHISFWHGLTSTIWNEIRSCHGHGKVQGFYFQNRRKVEEFKVFTKIAILSFMYLFKSCQ